MSDLKASDCKCGECAHCKNNKDSKYIGRGAIIALVILGIVVAGLFGWLYLVCVVYINKAPDETIVFITGAVGILAFGVAAVYTIFAMQQWRTMRAGLARTDRLLAQNERVIDITSKQNVQMFRQANLMQQQIEVTRDEMKQTDEHFGIAQRAYVIIDDVRFVSTTTGLQKQGSNPVNVRILNAGRTPARNVTITAHKELTATPFTELPITTVKATYRSKEIALIVPDNPFTFPHSFIQMDETDYLEWHSLKKHLFVQIAVWYRDIQDKEWLTHYWYEYGFNTGTFDVLYSSIGERAKPDLSRLWKFPDALLGNVSPDESKQDAQNPENQG